MLPNQLTVSPGLNGGSLPTDWAEFAKAIQSTDANADPRNLTGIGPLRTENLDTELRSVVATNDHFKFFKSLAKTPIDTPLLSFMVQKSRGGQVQGNAIGENGRITSNVGSYERWFTTVKYLATRAEITVQAARTNLAYSSARAMENDNALVRLSESANWMSFHGDPTVAPNQFAGIDRQLSDWEGGSQVVDLDGSSDINDVVAQIFKLKAKVQQRGRFGDVNAIWTDHFVQNDLDANLRTQFRVGLNASDPIQFGAPVSAIKTSTGPIELKHDIYINNFDNTRHPLVIDGQLPDDASSAPGLSATANAPTVTGSKFVTARAGAYYYAVAGINENGVIGQHSALATATVAANGAITLTITVPQGEAVTGYAIYRSVKAPTTTPSIADLRWLTNVPYTAASQTWQDLSQYIPGASNMYLINSHEKAIDYVQFAAPFAFEGMMPYDRMVYTWAVAMFGALRLALPNHHYLLRGYVPKDTEFKPFG